MLDKNKYKLDENIDFNKEREDWGNARTILVLLENIDKNHPELIEDSVITGIIYSKLYTKWEEEDNTDKIAVIFKEGSKLSLGIRSYLSGKISFFPDYTDETKEDAIKEYDGVIIYE